MIEIIPNWHPMFVHFTVALFSVAVLFLVLSYFFTSFSGSTNFLASEFEIVGRWNLWLVSLITIGTVLAGLYAYYTVNHSDASHNVMTTHRNWALVTATIILILGGWALWNYRKDKGLRLWFVISLLIGEVLLLITAWYGGELVYRHGTGVMSCPKEGAKHHHHHHESSIKNNKFWTGSSLTEIKNQKYIVYSQEKF